MKIQVSASAMARAVGMVKGCVPARTTMLVLNHILIDAADGRVTVKGTNLEMEAEARADAVVASAGSVAVPGEILHGLIKRIDKGATVDIETADNGRVVMESGRARYEIRALPPDEFPIFQRPEGAVEFEIDAAAMAALLESVAYAASTDETRYYLRGVYLVPHEGRMTAVATDGHRMGVRSAPLPPEFASAGGIIIPTDAVRQIMAILSGRSGTVRIATDHNRIWLVAADVTFASRLIDGDFPAWAQCLPPVKDATFSVRPPVLSDAVDRALIVYAETDEKAPAAHIVTGGNGIDLKAGRAAHDTAVETIDATVNHRGAELRVNARYLAEMLKLWGDVDLDVQVSDTPGGPVLFHSASIPDQRHIIMPQTR